MLQIPKSLINSITINGDKDSLYVISFILFNKFLIRDIPSSKIIVHVERRTYEGKFTWELLHFLVLNRNFYIFLSGHLISCTQKIHLTFLLFVKWSTVISVSSFSSQITVKSPFKEKLLYTVLEVEDDQHLTNSSREACKSFRFTTCTVYHLR